MMRFLMVIVTVLTLIESAEVFGFVLPEPIETEVGSMDALKKTVHVQGAAASEDAFYLSHYLGIEKFDWTGRHVGHTDEPNHLGDIAWHNGRLYGVFVIRGEDAKGMRGLIRVWDKDLKLIKEKRFPECFDGCTVLGDVLYVGVDKFKYEPQTTCTIMMLDLDLNEKGRKTIDIGYPVICNVQTMENDGKTLFLGTYGAKPEQGNPNGLCYTELTPNLEFVTNGTFKCNWGMARVPESLAPGKGPAYFVCERFYKNGPRIRLNFYFRKNGSFRPAWMEGWDERPMRERLIAHRGESIDAPENTLPAYETAVERGFGFECDVYLAKDGRLFTFHDATLSRTTGGVNTNRCTDVDWEGTVSKLNVGGWGRWKGTKFDPTRPALFSEVLSLAREGRYIYVEIKGDNPDWVPRIKAEVEKKRNVNANNILFISFGEKVCAEIKRQMPEYKVYLLTTCRARVAGKNRSDWPVRPAEDVVAKLQKLGVDGVDISFDPDVIDKRYVDVVKTAGFSFHVWTIDRSDVARKAFARGADTITTDCAKKIFDECSCN